MSLKDVLKGLAAVEKEIDGIKAAYAEVPESLKSFPCILNIPTSGEFDISFGGNNRHLINSIIIVDRAELPSSQNRILDLLEPVKDKISENSTLHDNCESCRVVGYSEYGVHSFAGMDYFGVTLEIEIFEGGD